MCIMCDYKEVMFLNKSPEHLILWAYLEGQSDLIYQQQAGDVKASPEKWTIEYASTCVREKMGWSLCKTRTWLRVTYARAREDFKRYISANKKKHG